MCHICIIYIYIYKRFTQDRGMECSRDSCRHMRYRLFFSNDPRHVSPTVCTRPSRLVIWIKGDGTFPSRKCSDRSRQIVLIVLVLWFNEPVCCVFVLEKRPDRRYSRDKWNDQVRRSKRRIFLDEVLNIFLIQIKLNISDLSLTLKTSKILSMF